MRMRFIFTAEDVCKIAYLGEEEDLFKRWMASPILNQVKIMDLGGNSHVPHRIGGAVDQVRRRLVGGTEYGPGYHTLVSTRNISA